jgi:hypothetical protein
MLTFSIELVHVGLVAINGREKWRAQEYRYWYLKPLPNLPAPDRMKKIGEFSRLAVARLLSKTTIAMHSIAQYDDRHNILW